MSLKQAYMATAQSPTLPPQIDGNGLLVGWSMSQEHKRQPIGFAFGDKTSSKNENIVDPILFSGEGHLMTIAATGAGKGVGCIIPALLTFPGPMIVIDPKGENAAITRRRREEMGQTVHVIDPMGVVKGKTSRLNPLDFVDPTSPMCVDDAMAIADMLSSHLKSDEKNAYWHNRGRHLLTALILDVVSNGDKKQRTLASVRKAINHSLGEGDNSLYEHLKDSPHPEARAAAPAFNMRARETLSGIVSVAQDMVDFVRGDLVSEATSTSDFSLDDITSGKPMTIYLVLPPYMLESHSALLRLWVGVLLKSIMRRKNRVKNPTMLLLDEAAQLGQFPPLRQAITLLRGYGLQTWSFWQDVDQLVHAYPDSWRSLINNCRVVQTFGAPNMSAARSIAHLFELLNPGQILDLDNDEMLVQMAGDDAFVARRPNYLTDPAFSGKFDPNPMYQEAPPEVIKNNPVKRLDNVYLREEDVARTDEQIIRDLLDHFAEK